MKNRILIVEDEIDLLDLIDFNLTRKGFITAGSLDGRDAIQKLDAFSPDLVVLDLMLPEVNGWEVCKAIKARNSEIPVIMLTAKCMPEDKVIGFETGADDYITKPFEIKELVIRINNLIEKKTQSELSRMLIHEMANRMAAIGCYSELLSNRYGHISEDNKDRYLQSISSQVAGTAELICEIGSLAAAGSAAASSMAEKTRISDLLKTLASFHATTARHKGVTIVYEEKDDLEVALNLVAVKQVLANLIGNAVKYSRESGRVEIYAASQAEGVVVIIKDDGPGIPAEDAPHIFKKGFRGSNAANSASGSGLGLFIVKQLLDRMNSTISFQSEEGNGTVFTVFFRQDVQAERLIDADNERLRCAS